MVVGFLLMTQVRHIPWEDYDVAIPAFLTIVLMPFTYSITNGIGAGFISYVVLRTTQGRWREPHALLWVVALLFTAYFLLQPIKEALDRRRGLGADELVHHLAAGEGLDRRDALDAEALRQAGVGVGVYLGQNYLALPALGFGLEQRAERLAWPTPSGPEVHHDRQRRRALDDLSLKVLLGDVDHGHGHRLADAVLVLPGCRTT